MDAKTIVAMWWLRDKRANALNGNQIVAKAMSGCLFSENRSGRKRASRP